MGHTRELVHAQDDITSMLAGICCNLNAYPVVNADIEYTLYKASEWVTANPIGRCPQSQISHSTPSHLRQSSKVWSLSSSRFVDAFGNRTESERRTAGKTSRMCLCVCLGSQA